jgi:hypothetical protein
MLRRCMLSVRVRQANQPALTIETLAAVLAKWIEIVAEPGLGSIIVTDHIYYMYYFWEKIKICNPFSHEKPVIMAKIRREKIMIM